MRGHFLVGDHLWSCSYGEHIPTFKALSIVFNPETKLIDLTLFEEHQDVAVPLLLQFQYCPLQGFTPIHKISSGHNKRIKQFYWKLWFGDNEVLPNINIQSPYLGWSQDKYLLWNCLGLCAQGHNSYLYQTNYFHPLLVINSSWETFTERSI